jgi:hypothetical protein
MRNKPTPRNTASVLAVAAIVALSAPASAASSANNTVMDIAIEFGTQVARIGLNGGPYSSGRPTCHNVAYNSYWAFDISTAKGKALLATAQAALLSGKTVSVSGVTTGTTLCTNIAASGTINIETLGRLILFAN